MPNLLFIDTSAAVATVALSADGRISALLTHESANEQAAVLPALIADVLQRAGITLDQVDALCVCAGPGSYTGLRVGLSAAKGLAYAKDIPLMLFNRLDLLAWSQDHTIPFAIALKARAGEYFFATYTASGETDAAPQHIFAEELRPFAERDLLFITDDAEFVAAEQMTLFDAHHALKMERWISRAEKRFSHRKFDDLAYSEPFYLKGAYTTQRKK